MPVIHLPEVLREKARKSATPTKCAAPRFGLERIRLAFVAASFSQKCAPSPAPGEQTDQGEHPGAGGFGGDGRELHVVEVHLRIESSAGQLDADGAGVGGGVVE